jgi:hypothetical protein
MQVDESAVHTFGEEQEFRKRYPTPSPTPSRRSQTTSRGISPYFRRKEKELTHKPMGHKVTPTITKERRREIQTQQDTDNLATEEEDECNEDREDVYMKTPRKSRKSELVPPPGNAKITQYFHGQTISSQTTIPSPTTPKQTDTIHTQATPPNAHSPLSNPPTPTPVEQSPTSVAPPTIEYPEHTNTPERKASNHATSQEKEYTQPATPPTPTRLGLTGNETEQQTW